MICCSVFDEAVSALALKNSGKILARNRKILSENREILHNWILSQKNYSYVKPAAGTTALIYYDANTGSKEFCDKLSKQNGVFTTPVFVLSWKIASESDMEWKKMYFWTD